MDINAAAMYLLDNHQPADEIDDSEGEEVDPIAKFIKILADSYAKSKK
jgi:hypothetical protein